MILQLINDTHQFKKNLFYYFSFKLNYLHLVLQLITLILLILNYFLQDYQNHHLKMIFYKHYNYSFQYFIFIFYFLFIILICYNNFLHPNLNFLLCYMNSLNLYYSLRLFYSMNYLMIDLIFQLTLLSHQSLFQNLLIF